jgi:hypothetical protein
MVRRSSRHTGSSSRVDRRHCATARSSPRFFSIVSCRSADSEWDLAVPTLLVGDFLERRPQIIA